MKNPLLFGALASLALAGGCIAAPDGAPAEPPPASPAPQAERSLPAWLDAQYEEELRFSPMQLTFQGRKERYDELDDFSVEGFERQLAWKQASVETMKATFDRAALSPDEQISYDLWIYQAEQMAAERPWVYERYVFNQMSGPQSFLATFLINFHRVEGVSDMEAYVARLVALERAMDQLLTIAEEGTDRGLRYPRFALDGVIEQADKVVSGAPFEDGEDSDLWADVKTEVDGLEGVDPEKKAELRAAAEAALVDHVKPAYARLVAWAKEERARSPEVATGVGSREDGAAYYAHRLKSQTTTDLSADAIHTLGRSEVARLRAAMEAVKDEVGFDGDLDAFFEEVRTGAWNFYPDTDAGRQQYITDAKAAIDNIETQLPRYFGLLPQAGLVVKRVEPFREQDGAAQHYFPGTPDGSRPGTYYAHLSDMTAMPKNQLEVIAYHEGIPGHHMQISIAQELEGVPKFRTQAMFTAYVEGWALYAEKLAKEMPGTYADPYSELGRLSSEMWRALRLVVDAGLHGKGWTEEQAIDYMMQNSPEPEESVRSEVRRYLTWPGQATCYKIGMIEILRLRAEAEETLGERFDIRGFHDAVLGGGAVPLPILARQVGQWVDRQAAPTASAL